MAKAERRFTMVPVFIGLMVTCVFFGLTGCAGTGDSNKPDGHEPVLLPESLSRAVEAAGGGGAWTAVRVLNADCVLTLYRPDGTFYLTEQHHQIRPWANSVKISAEEPQGSFTWLLSEEGFRKLLGPNGAADVCNRHMAVAILQITAVPAVFLQRPGDFSQQGDPVRMEGLWYRPIESAGAAGPRAVFYQASGGRVDQIRKVFPGGNGAVRVRGYDYTLVTGKGILVPATIEVFSTERRGRSETRLAKIEYYSLR